MCIFCKIIKKEIPAHIVYEDEKVMAFLDISQVTKGHTLVIPKKHCETILDCDEDILAQMMQITQHLGKQIIDKFDAKGLHVLSNAYEIAGQTVPHFHIHLIPRYNDQDACIIHFEPSPPQDLEMIKKELMQK